MRAWCLGIILFVAVTTAACSGSTATTTPGTSDPTTAAAAPSSTSNADACATFTAQDASAILNQPVGDGVPKSVTADAMSCLYQGKTNIVQTVTVTVYSGALAQTVVSTFASQYQGSVPVQGVGDSAVRDATGSVLAAIKGKRACAMHYVGDDPASPDAFSTKLAAVCTKVLAGS